MFYKSISLIYFLMILLNILKIRSNVYEKATWDPKENEAFIEACLEQITKGEHLGSSFTKVGTYNKAQLKNKYDNLIKDWRVWYKLFRKETGLGWDNTRNTENPLYGKFRYKGLPFAHQLTILFKDVVVTKDFIQAIGSQKSGEKRKRIDRTEKIGKKKLNASSKIGEAVSDIAKTCRSRIENVTSASINEVVKELKTLPEVANDTELHTKCCNLMLFKPAREMLIALRGEDEKRLHWLKDAVKNRLFMNMSL
ncbi:hypothetical protein GLYMA_17G177400v4 [Glycine max]|uniref:Myb/SANT-like domain-containing protein n=2 Tax=Glycine subgen. Soja TaxID=1462606 RepID=A0A0R0FMP8_SOYBN|nr:hypothetical protein GYH30_047638 [Glycine max]KRH04658.1 hypothetical protein GLYMA_17G177400v4 [Glycine max]RZB57376.1 hypothetical protein D0Y65_046164 [Glycine soja]